jgi:hypothetical protein
MYENLFKTVQIWKPFQDRLSDMAEDGIKRKGKEKREHLIQLSFSALTNVVLLEFRDAWKYSSTNQEA